MDCVVSLFAGAGGLSSGFSAAGFAPSVAVEIDRDACGTYERNIGLAPLNMDVSDPATIDAIIGAIGQKSVAAVIGGPPCQGFSTAGGRSVNDPRNRLIFSYFSIVDALRPRWFLFENVEGLLTAGGGNAIVELVRSFIERGYSLRLEKVNFASYGLPQARKRVILVGNRLGSDFSLPMATHSFNAGKHRSKNGLQISPTLNEALSGLGLASDNSMSRVAYHSDMALTPYDALMRSNNTDVSMHFWSASEADKERYQHLRPGQTMRDLPEHLWHSSFKRRAFRRVKDGTPTERRGGPPSGIKRLQGDYNSLTITSAATQEFIHPTEDRPLTLREAARLQSFPDSYEFDGLSVSKARQIGNAFPPLCAELLARHLMEIDATFGSGMRNMPKLPPGLIDFLLTDASGMSPALRSTNESLTALSQNQLHFEVEEE